MPEYEYRCKKCKQDFVIERAMTDSSSVVCIRCGNNELVRIWNANFISSGKQSKVQAAASTETCAANPAKPKSCCPCD
jgi:putative FmdB family regulatory protein